MISEGGQKKKGSDQKGPFVEVERISSAALWAHPVYIILHYAMQCNAKARQGKEKRSKASIRLCLKWCYTDLDSRTA